MINDINGLGIQYQYTSLNILRNCLYNIFKFDIYNKFQNLYVKIFNVNKLYNKLVKIQIIIYTVDRRRCSIIILKE